MNAANDNPLIFDEGDKTFVISGGNFHGQPIAFALDHLKLDVSELANVSERRLERLVNPQLNGDLPAFLSPVPGLQSGAMIMQQLVLFRKINPLYIPQVWTPFRLQQIKKTMCQWELLLQDTGIK